MWKISKYCISRGVKTKHHVLVINNEYVDVGRWKEWYKHIKTTSGWGLVATKENDLYCHNGIFYDENRVQHQ